MHIHKCMPYQITEKEHEGTYGSIWRENDIILL